MALTTFNSSTTAERILYAGDDDIDRAAVYLSSILFDQEYSFDYLASSSRLPNDIDLTRYDLLILSDYPSKQFDLIQLGAISRYVKNGGSFLMIGGWESFTGMEKEYCMTPIEDILPVTLSIADDRVNLPQGCIVLPKILHHPIAGNLPWNRPAIIGGFNELKPRPDADIVLTGKRLSIRNEHALTASISAAEIPLLITGRSGKGFSAALAFDLAPHWIGGFVDWGLERITIEFNNSIIEVGDAYYRFVANLIAFCIRKGSRDL